MDKTLKMTQHLFPEVDPEVVEKIIRSQFLFVKDTMEHGEYETIMLAKLGKFACKTFRIQKLHERLNRKQSGAASDPGPL